MKILFLGFAKVKFMPFAHFYMDQIDTNKNEIHFVYWNRDLKEEDLSAYSRVHFHEFREKMSDSIPKKQKLIHFWKYRQFVAKILWQNRFDRIIAMDQYPGLLLYDKIARQYKKRYVFDYRDSTFEHSSKPFAHLVKRFALNSYKVFTSSDAFRQFLPKDGVEVITSHNILRDSLNHRDDRVSDYVPSDKIRISFWGLVRHLEHNLLIIDRIGNDPRFELHYYGKSIGIGDEIEEYCQARNIENVFLHGEYRPEERYEFVKHTDILHNSYYDANMVLAMGNKYYDGIIFRIPQLCMEGSYMAQRCISKGVGIALDPRDDSYADKLFEYYTSLNWDSFAGACDADLESVIGEYDYGAKIMKAFLND